MNTHYQASRIFLLQAQEAITGGNEPKFGALTRQAKAEKARHERLKDAVNALMLRWAWIRRCWSSFFLACATKLCNGPNSIRHPLSHTMHPSPCRTNRPSSPPPRASNQDKRNTWTVDLHGLTAKAAVEQVARTLEQMAAMATSGGVTVKFVTGRGLHSAGNVPVLRAQVCGRGSWRFACCAARDAVN
jgi:hypothetical protein